MTTSTATFFCRVLRSVCPVRVDILKSQEMPSACSSQYTLPEKPSGLNIDLGSAVNAYFPIGSFRSTPRWDRGTIRSRQRIERSSFNCITTFETDVFNIFRTDVHCCRFTLGILNQVFTVLVLILCCTKLLIFPLPNFISSVYVFSNIIGHHYVGHYIRQTFSIIRLGVWRTLNCFFELSNIIVIAFLDCWCHFMVCSFTYIGQSSHGLCFFRQSGKFWCDKKESIWSSWVESYS